MRRYDFDMPKLGVRQGIRTSVLGGGHAGTITDLKWRRVDLAVDLKHPGTGQDPIRMSNWILAITLDDGSVGHGEAVHYPGLNSKTRGLLEETLKRARALVVGQRAQPWTKVADLLARHKVLSAVRCGVEQGLLDALARQSDRSLVEFFGGSPRTLMTPMTVVPGSVSDAVEAARAAASLGFTAVKVKVAGPYQFDIDRLQRIHEAEPRLAMSLDANGTYTRDEVLRLLDRLEGFGARIGMLEQPLAAGEWAHLPELERTVGVPVCADESLTGTRRLNQLEAVGGVHAVNVKLMRFGFAGALKLLARAEELGVACMVGATSETVVSASFAAALGAAFPEVVRYADLDTPFFMTGLDARGGLAYTGGTLTLAGSVAGTGVELPGLFDG